MKYQKYLAFVMSAAVAATLQISPAAPAAAQGYRTVTLESGTVIPVKLRDTLSSTDSRAGDRFTATLQSEESARSLRLPVGTVVEGTVSAARPMKDKDPGVIALNFDRILLPNESSYPIKGSLIGLDDKSVTRSSNGRLVAKADHKNKTLLYAGYGAGAGLILGAITKGNTILDTLLGGGLGYLLGTLDKSHGDPRDVTLKPNTELGVRLDRSVNIKQYDDRSDSSYSDRKSYPRTQTDRYGNPVPSDTNRDRYDDPVRSDANRDRYGDPVRPDPNRDPYDDPTADDRSVSRLGTYDVLNQYTDIRDNGEPIRVFVNGRELSFLSSARPFISGGTVMVPAIPVLKAQHARYSYTSSQFTANGPGESLTGTFGSRAVTGSGTHRFTLPASIQRRNGTVYVPIQFLAIVSGQRLNFDRYDQSVEFGIARSESLRH